MQRKIVSCRCDDEPLLVTFVFLGSLFQSLLKEDHVWGAVGCHPKEALEYNKDQEAALKEMLQHKKIVALGEIGLDYSKT